MSISYPGSRKSGQSLPAPRLPEQFPPAAVSNVRADAPSLLTIRMETLAVQGGRLHSYGLE